MRRWGAATAAGVLALALLAGCGGGDDDGDAADATTTTGGVSTTVRTAVTDTTAASDVVDTTVVEDPGPEVFAREDVPDELGPQFVDLAVACFDGDMESCDTLASTTPVDTVDELYGVTCGGRILPEDTIGGECATIITGPIDVPESIFDVDLAFACHDGEMVACDTLFDTAAPGSIDEQYGGYCGGRVLNTIAYCVDIFGDFAYL